MDLLADISQCGARGEDERLLEVSLSIRTLQIDPHEVQSLPDPVREHIHVETLLRGDGHEIGTHLLFHGGEILVVDEVYLVEDDVRGHVSRVPSYYIDQLVVVDVLTNQN